MPLQVGPWDVTLIIAVSLLGTGLAYVQHPKWKAAFLLLPIPFTLAALSLGRPVGITNVVGLPVLLLYAHAVRVLHQHWRVPIIPAIIIAVLLYCALGTTLARVLPTGETAFWTACVLVIALGWLLHTWQPSRDEPGHRTPLPVGLKLPMTAGVVCALVLIKQFLQGFMTLFPMVGVLASYEARHSLWTNSKQIPVNMLTLTPMIATVHALQPRVGLPSALALSWVVLLMLLIPLTRDIWTSPLTAVADSSHADMPPASLAS